MGCTVAGEIFWQLAVQLNICCFTSCKKNCLAWTWLFWCSVVRPLMSLTMICFKQDNLTSLLFFALLQTDWKLGKQCWKITDVWLSSHPGKVAIQTRVKGRYCGGNNIVGWWRPHWFILLKHEWWRIVKAQGSWILQSSGCNNSSPTWWNIESQQSVFEIMLVTILCSKPY